MASAKASTVGSSTSSPVSPGTTVSSAPPRASATTGRPQACASSGTMPKSSSPGSSTTASAPVEVSDSLVGDPSDERRATVGPALERRTLGTVADNQQRHLGARARVDGEVDALVGDERRDNEGIPFRRAGVRTIEVSIDRRIHNCGLAIIVSADPARNIMRDSHIAVHPVGGVAVPAGQTAPSPAASAGCRPRRADPGRNRRRTGPRHSASASGSSRDVWRAAPSRTDFTAQWLMLKTRSNRSRSNCSTAAGNTGRHCR